MKQRTKERALSVGERTQLKGALHKEEMERKDMEKECILLDNLEKKRKAVEKFEKMKREQQREARLKNVEKSATSKQQAKDMQDYGNRINNELKRKEKKVAEKLAAAEETRLLELELKRERQKLVHEENQRRIEMQKRTLHFKKLQILEKHKNKEDEVTRIMDGKSQFIECSRIANEIRVQKMLEMHTSPNTS